MKKTISILALCVCSAAASFGEWTYDPAVVGNLEKEASGTNIHSWSLSDENLTWSSGSQFSIAMTLDVNSLNENSNYAVFSIKDVSYNGLVAFAIQQGSINLYNWKANVQPEVQSVALDSLSAKETLTLVLSRDSGDIITYGVYADGNFETGVTMTRSGAFAFNGKTFQELNFGGSPADYTNSWSCDMNTVLPANTDAEAFTLLGAGYMTGGTANADQLSTFYTNIVPEPTTAALGALLLVGVAGRRRRR